MRLKIVVTEAKYNETRMRRSRGMTVKIVADKIG